MNGSNIDIYNYLKGSPTFQRWMPKVTADIFTEAGFAEMSYYDINALTNFFGLAMQFVLNKILDVRVRIPDFYGAIVEEYSSEKGGIQQRIYNTIQKPISPQGINLEEGTWVNDLIIRKGKQSQRFWKQNMWYANLDTIKEDELQKAFLDERGISEFVAMKQAGLQKSYMIYKSKFAREVLAGALQADGTTVPALRDTQVFDATKYADLAGILSDTQGEVQAAALQLIDNLALIHDAMTTANTVSTFNADGFEDAAYPEEHVLLIRSDVKRNIQKFDRLLSAGTGSLKPLWPEIENSGFKVVVVDGLGHIITALKSDPTTILKPVFQDNTFQYQIGWNTTGGVGTKEDCVPESDIVELDDDVDTFACLAQKGVVWSVEQTPYKTQVKQSFLGGYYNLLAKKENEAMNYDAHYNLVKFSKATA